MTFEDFDKYQRELFDECIQMRNTKGREYCVGRDRFENFKTEGAEIGVDPLIVAEIFMNKHMRSIKSFIKNRSQLVAPVLSEAIRGRFVDAIVYLTLMIGIIEEAEIEESKKPLVSKLNFNEINEGNGICLACKKALNKHCWWADRHKYHGGECLPCIMLEDMQNSFK